MNEQTADVASFYDTYTERQVGVGINDRHRAILEHLRTHGLRPGQRVLEIGCGIGTVTELLANYIGPAGHICATDLSPRSIEIARERLGRHSHVNLIAADVLDLDCACEFDVVVLPDVIEHIPLASHPALFSRLAAWIKPDGFIFLHYPNPHHLEWQHEHQPEALQIIDQPVHADHLTAIAANSNLYLTYYCCYSIWHSPSDYVAAVLRPVAGVGSFVKLSPPRPTITRRLAGRLRRVLAGQRTPQRR